MSEEDVRQEMLFKDVWFFEKQDHMQKHRHNMHVSVSREVGTVRLKAKKVEIKRLDGMKNNEKNQKLLEILVKIDKM